MNQPDSRELAGTTAVVTGSSSGIGRAIALLLAECGANVLVHARRSQAAAEAVADQIRRGGTEAKVELCDLAVADNYPAFVERAWSWQNGVDIWVNNAGADVLIGPAAHHSFDQKLDALLRVDVCATMHLSRAVGQRMASRGRGAIINVSWDRVAAGMAGDTGQLFAATKGAVEAFSMSLARTLAPTVRVNCVAPGWIKTAWGEQASQIWQDRARDESLLGRWGSPEDVAGAVRYLASPAAAFITAQTIAVNGGIRS